MRRKSTQHSYLLEGSHIPLEAANEAVTTTHEPKQTKRPKLDADKLRKMAGCEHLSLAEAEEVCRTMYNLARLFYRKMVGEQPLVQV